MQDRLSLWACEAGEDVIQVIGKFVHTCLPDGHKTYPINDKYSTGSGNVTSGSS